MKAYLRGLLTQWVGRLVDYLLDVVLDDKVAWLEWLEAQIQKMDSEQDEVQDGD
jgi:hypothetical protein